MQAQRVVICGLARDVRPHLPRTMARIERLGEMFKEYRVVVFENDSTDGTWDFLGRWAEQNPCVHLLSDTLASPRFPQTRSLVRAATLAAYRNRYREYALRHFGDFDKLVVVDMDLCGGWSYDGVANTFGHDDWDFVGSYGIASRMNNFRCENVRVHFDAWAFRKLGHPEPHPASEINGLHFRRGDPLVPVLSCFGGLGIYRMACVHAASYGGDDCEHVAFHRDMMQAGFKRLFFNPSQIVIY